MDNMDNKKSIQGKNKEGIRGKRNSNIYPSIYSKRYARARVVPCPQNIFSEKVLERKLRDEVARRGGLAVKLYSAYNTGMPDRMVLMPGGRVWFVELKSTGRKPTPLQRMTIDRWRGMGFDVSVVDSQQTLDDFIGRL